MPFDYAGIRGLNKAVAYSWSTMLGQRSKGRP